MVRCLDIQSEFETVSWAQLGFSALFQECAGHQSYIFTHNLHWSGILDIAMMNLGALKEM